jgi:hypothetical protein
MDELKASESEVDSDSSQILKEGSKLSMLNQFHYCYHQIPSKRTRRTRGRGTPLSLTDVGQGGSDSFHVDSGSQKNLISLEVVKRLDLPMTHPQPYTIDWLRQGRDLYVNQQCRFPYDIKPSKDEVLCDISPLEVCDVILGQPYFWKRHVVYESIPHNVIITLGRQLYRIPEVVPPTSISLISTKKCSKVISQIGKFVFFVIHAHSKQKVAATSMASTQCLSL